MKKALKILAVILAANLIAALAGGIAAVAGATSFVVACVKVTTCLIVVARLAK